MRKEISKIQIGGLTYTVFEDDMIAAADICYGTTNSYTQEIVLDSRCSYDRKYETLIHEMMHAVWANVGLKSRGYTSQQEEEVIDSLSAGMYAIFKNNKNPFSL